MTSRADAVRELFCSAIDRAASERLVFLQEADCDTSVKDEVRALLAHHESPAAALQTQGSTEVDAEQRSAAPGPNFGRYRLIERLGEGGMGIVYKAEQEQPRRMVAVKVLRTNLASEESGERLIREAETLGRLSHPGIAQIFEAGCVLTDSRPQPFIAMEYVEGRPLTLFAQERRQSVAERLAMFIRVCEAVQHAHDRGIIHRDLKPGNILVTGAGQPKVLDFGIALGVETGAHAESGGPAGTVAYMSPEQASGDSGAVDGRTDVYSLGVLLFELIEGRLPLDVRSKPLPEALRMVREGEPPGCGQPYERLCGDLRIIAAQALQRDRLLRYATPAELAADVRRFFEHRPILARRGNVVYRAARFSRRHRVGVGLLVAVLLTLCAGVVISLREAARADHRARQARAMATAFREAIVGPRWSAWRGKNVRISERLLDIRRHLRGQIQGEPELEAGIQAALGRGLLNIYDLEDAEEALRTAISLWEEGRGANVLEVLAARCDLGETLIHQGRFAEAEELFRGIVSDHACHEDPVVLVNSLMGLGTVLHRQSRSIDALPILETAERVAREHFAEDHPVNIVARMNLAMMLCALGRAEEAERMLRRNEAMLGTMNDEMQAFQCENALRLGALLLQRGHNGEASALFERALSMQRMQEGAASAWTIDAMLFKAGQRWVDGDLTGAEVILREAVDLSRRYLPPLDMHRSNAVNNLGVCLRNQGRLEEAETHLREAMEARRRVLGRDSPAAGASAINLARLKIKTGEVLEALDMTLESLRVRLQLTDRCEALESLVILGCIECSLGMRAPGLFLVGAGVQERLVKGLQTEWRTDVAVDAAVETLGAMNCVAAARTLLQADLQMLTTGVGESNAATERARRRLERLDQRMNRPRAGLPAGGSVAALWTGRIARC